MSPSLLNKGDNRMKPQSFLVVNKFNVKVKYSLHTNNVNIDY